MSEEALKKWGLPPPLETPRSGGVSDEDFEYFRGLILKLLGIHLSPAKKDLLQARLRSRVQELGLSRLGEYRAYLRTLPDAHAEWQLLMNLMTTNKTDWFREPKHFTYLVENFLPEWKARGKRKLEVWSAASSTGEEPYTLATVLNHALGESAAFEILGTDIDTNVLAHARNGVYARSLLEQVPDPYKSTTFGFGTGAISGWMKVRSAVKRHVSFQQLNLSTPPYPWSGRFDIIFCRNVLIYFPRDVIETVIEGLYQAAAPGALLVIGHSESLQNIKVSWSYKQPSIFIKPERRR